MCVYSFVADHFYDKWTRPPYVIPAKPYEQPPIPWQPPPPFGPPVIVPYVPMPGLPATTSPVTPPTSTKVKGRLLTPEEIDELRVILEKAREYDERTGQPDCETEDKIEKLKKLILELAPEADISFLDQEKK